MTVDQRRIHAKSLGTFSVIADQLSRVLTPKLTALVCDFRDPKALARYASGEQLPRQDLEQRLRFVFQIVATLMVSGLPPEGVQAWFTGMNPDLEDRAPAELLRTGDDEARRRVLQAARAHAEIGDLSFQGEVGAPEASKASKR